VFFVLPEPDLLFDLGCHWDQRTNFDPEYQESRRLEIPPLFSYLTSICAHKRLLFPA
jgi:hypothetical protein